MAESKSTHESHGLSRSFPIILWALAYKQLSRHDSLGQKIKRIKHAKNDVEIT